MNLQLMILINQILVKNNLKRDVDITLKMDVFEFYKTIRLKKAKKYFSQLEKLYSKIPDTKGCLENINKEKGCGGWCCFHQSPQLLYVEFLYAWDEIFNNWDLEEIADVIELAMINYVLGFTTKGCIFFDKSTKLLIN